MKKGFTLIELLAVIIILGIIALIAVPKVGNVINESKQRAAIVTANNYIAAVNEQILKNKLVANGNYIDDGTYNVNDLDIKMKGEYPAGGKVTIENGKVKNIKLHISTFEVSGNPNDLNVSTYVTNYANQTDAYDVPFDSLSGRISNAMPITAKLEKDVTYHITGHVKVVVLEKIDGKTTDYVLHCSWTWKDYYAAFGRKYNIGVNTYEWDIDKNLKSVITSNSATVMVIDNTYVRGNVTITNLKVERVD